MTLASCAGAAIAVAQDQRARWNGPQEPFRIFGSTYYVGTRGLSVILIASDAGHVLIDGALPESVPLLTANIRGLGFALEDVRLIVNSHAHFDHAGGIGELQRLSGARVAVTAESARVLESGRSGPDDPQYGVVPPIPPVANVELVGDGETLRVGPLAVTAHRTGGHTPGGTSWTWRACEQDRCLDVVYADSVTAVSADGFAFSRSTTYPDALRDFERTFAFLSGVSCDLLMTPHPEVSDLWGRLDRRAAGDAGALVDRTACRRYADAGRARLAARLEAERKP